MIGADGRNSRIARAVDAETYDEKPVLQWVYYTYWRGLPVDGFETYIRPERGFAAVATNYLRKPYGPGWMLVSDAAYSRDPITALGISDAFRDATQASVALDRILSGDGCFGDVMAAYHADRDAAVLPMYAFTTELATLEPPPAQLQQLLASIAGNQAAMDAFVSLTAGTMAPAEFFDPVHLAAFAG